MYRFLRRNSELYNAAKDQTSEIPWNFAKFIVNKQGQVVKYMGPREDPNDAISLIEKMVLEA